MEKEVHMLRQHSMVQVITFELIL
uniref:Uncharacterized protein n=1 Tax=Anguilla anguilla TaxID=7936 RepID=A0A0E9V8R8_ANGAN